MPKSCRQKKKLKEPETNTSGVAVCFANSFEKVTQRIPLDSREKVGVIFLHGDYRHESHLSAAELREAISTYLFEGDASFVGIAEVALSDPRSAKELTPAEWIEIASAM